MEILDFLKNAWSKAFQFVGEHPKTTLVIGAAVVIVLLLFK